MYGMPSRPGDIPCDSGCRAASNSAAARLRPSGYPYPAAAAAGGSCFSLYCLQQCSVCSSTHRASSQNPLRGCTAEETGQDGGASRRLTGISRVMRGLLESAIVYSAGMWACLSLAMWWKQKADCSPYCAQASFGEVAPGRRPG